MEVLESDGTKRVRAERCWRRAIQKDCLETGEGGRTAGEQNTAESSIAHFSLRHARLGVADVLWSGPRACADCRLIHVEKGLTDERDRTRGQRWE